MEEKANKVLKSLGLSKNEVIVFLDLLRYSPSTALEISKRTKLHRSNVYDILRFLENKGLVSKFVTEDKTSFKALEPGALKNYIKSIEKNVDEIIPELEKIKKSKFQDEIATVSYGLPGLLNSFQNMMGERCEIKIFNAPANIMDILGKDFMEEFHEWRIKHKMISKVIYAHECERVRQIKDFPFLEVTCMPGDQESLCPFVVCQNHVYFLLLTNPPTVIEINSTKIADTFNKSFDYMWDKLHEDSRL